MSAKSSVPPDADADKKIAVLKKAVLALTKQKQDAEAARVSLEAKVASLVEELGRAEDGRRALEEKAASLQRRLDEVQAAPHAPAAQKTAPAASGIASARSLLGSLVGTATARASAISAEDQQRLFEENEGLHIQLFEQRSTYDRKVRDLEARRDELTAKLHSLEGVVASIQAADIAQSEAADETKRQLTIERGFVGLCSLLLTNASAPRSDMLACWGLIAKQAAELLALLVSGVGAVLVNIGDIDASDGGQYASIVAGHRDLAARIAKRTAALAAAPDIATELDAIRLLLTDAESWLLMLYRCAALLTGPLERSHAERKRAHAGATLALAGQVREAAAAAVGELRFVRDAFALAAARPNDAMAGALLERCLAAALSVRIDRNAPSASGGTSAATLVARLAFDCDAALAAVGSCGGPAPAQHFRIATTQLLQLIKSWPRRWQAALGMTTGGTASSPSAERDVAGGLKGSASRDRLEATRHLLATLAATATAEGATGGALIPSAAGPSGEAVDPNDALVRRLTSEITAQTAAADANAMHFFTVSQRALLELARAHDRAEALGQKCERLERDTDRMKREYVSVVDVYEGQIRILSDRLAELSPSN